MSFSKLSLTQLRHHVQAKTLLVSHQASKTQLQSPLEPALPILLLSDHLRITPQIGHLLR